MIRQRMPYCQRIDADPYIELHRGSYNDQPRPRGQTDPDLDPLAGRLGDYGTFESSLNGNIYM